MLDTIDGLPIRRQRSQRGASSGKKGSNPKRVVVTVVQLRVEATGSLVDCSYDVVEDGVDVSGC